MPHPQLVGLWYIKHWAGHMPLPKKKRGHGLPPFSFVMNSFGKLESGGTSHKHVLGASVLPPALTRRWEAGSAAVRSHASSVLSGTPSAALLALQGLTATTSVVTVPTPA